jgi:nitrate/nitrite transporter NarK
VSGRQRFEGPWGLVAGSWLLAAALNAYIIVPASFLPVLSEQLAIDATAASWIVSALFAVGVLVGIPAGIVLDRVDNRWAATLAAASLLAACLWSWQAARGGSYWSLLAARALAGISFPLIWSACINLIGRTFEAANRASAVGIFTTSAPAGFAVGQFTGPLIVARFGWAAPFAVFAIPIALSGAAFHLTSRSASRAGRSTRADGGTADADAQPQFAEFKRVLTDRNVLSIAGMGFVAYSAYVFFNSWMPTYLTEELGLSLAASGLLVAVFPAIGVLSRSGSGFISDRFLAQRRRPIVTVAFAATLPLVGVIALTELTPLVAGSLLLAGLFVQLGIGILFTYVQELVDPTVTATALSALTTMSSFGSFSAPVITGYLIESTRTYLAAFGYAALVVGLGVVLAYYSPEPNRSP